MNGKILKNTILRRRNAAIAACAFLIAFAAFEIWQIRSNANLALDKAREIEDKQNEIEFKKIVRQPLDKQNIEIWQNTNDARAVARFHDSIFAATNGGLLRFSLDGDLLRHWTILDGLPDSDLTALAVFNDRLFIGTKNAGLVEFDDKKFTSYVLRGTQTKAITALLAADSKLLIGTSAAGLLEFDGSRLREIKPQNKRFAAVNFLAKTPEKLFAGTFAEGVWINQNDVWQQFTTSDGLPSNRVVGALESGENVFVATDLGVAAAAKNELFATRANSKIFFSLAAVPTLSSLVKFDDRIFLTKDDGAILALDNDAARGNSFALKKLTNNTKTLGARLISANGELWFASRDGIERLRDKTKQNLVFASFNRSAPRQTLTGSKVSALAVDRNARIWAGDFSGGIDVLSETGERIKHLESETAREINALLLDPQTQNVFAATAAGVAGFDARLRENNVSESEFLARKSVMQAAFVAANEQSPQSANNEIAFATNRGLLLRGKNGEQLLTRVNGLPSDNVFTVLSFKNKIYAGTLGGLAVIENGRVARAFTDSNSKLTHNWITALCAARDRIFVGTYGGAVFELTAANELHAFANETGKFAVNPNALHTDGEQLFAGTLDGARVLDLETQKWTTLRGELPAETVLSVTSDDKTVYFGTTNGIARINKNYLRNKQNEKNEF